MIRLRRLEKAHPLGAGQFLYVLRHVNLDVREGEFISIMGPSGAGKSSLLAVLGLQDPAWEGEYFFDDQAVHQMKPKERTALRNANVGFVFQSYRLLDDLTVYENIEVPLTYRHVKPAQRQATVCDLLDRFGIVGKKDLYPAQLSGGQQQLVGVVRALVARPRLLLADEPTGNLHSDQGREVMELFGRLNREEGMTVVQVTHDERNAAYGQRVIRLKDGWVEKEPAGASGKS